MAPSWSRVRLGVVAKLHTEQLNPAFSPNQLFQLFSLPAFDEGQVPHVELGSRIESQKLVVPPTAILVSKLNPRIPRVWEPHVSVDLPAIASTEFLVLVPQQGFDRRYLKYACLSPKVRSQMESLVTGTSGSHQRVHPEDFQDIEVDVPDTLAEQHAIVRILGALDDKIELDRRMNETLESMARTLFKSWFIDFDPVHAKAEGRDPGLPADIAALFPDSFQDSDLGEIPEGWRLGRLGDVSVSPRRGVRPDEISPETPYIALEHMPRRSIALTEWGNAEGLESSKFEFEKGEILFGKLRPYFHKVGVAPVDGVCSTDIVVLAPRAKDWLGFVLGHASSVAFVEYTNSGSTGTKMPRTSWSEMARYPVALPTEEVVKEFSSKVCPLIDKIVLSVHESHTLASLRDTLLPKLLSGELRVKDVDRSMEAHA